MQVLWAQHPGPAHRRPSTSQAPVRVCVPRSLANPLFLANASRLWLGRCRPWSRTCRRWCQAVDGLGALLRVSVWQG